MNETSHKDNDFCITVSNVSRQVDTPQGNLTILQDINLNVKFGEALIMTGESGSGKTTLLGLMAGLDSADQGDIQLLGQSLANKTEEQRAAIRKGKVGFVFQSFHLIKGATALQNVVLPLELAGHKNAHEVSRQSLQKVGLSHRMDTIVDHLSGGEQQRVALARAYAGEPEILFADEPTGNLDSKTGEQIIDLLFDLRDQTGASLVMVTHEQRLAKRGDRQIQLEQGRLVS